MIAKTKNSSIFCIEDNWSRKNTDGISAEPFLEALKWYHEIDVELRPANNKADLLSHVKEWAGADWKYSILYFWYHGSPNAISPGDDQVALDEISEIVSGCCEGTGLIHFGACSTLRLTDDSFLMKTGAAAVSGYRVDVDWVDSLAFEMLYMHCVQRVVSKMLNKDPDQDVYLTPDVMQKVWRRLDKKPTRSLLDHLHFDLRVATGSES